MVVYQVSIEEETPSKGSSKRCGRFWGKKTYDDSLSYSYRAKGFDLELFYNIPTE